MYDDYAFGSRALEWATPAVEPWSEGHSPRDEVVGWLIEAHRRLVAHVTALEDDDELDRPRRTNWGEMPDALDHRGVDHARRVPRRRDQPPSEHARFR